ncbi:MAG: hypothetical protein ACXV5N_12195 [Halobacteriota archaeon]
MNEEQYNELSGRYGYWSSWAIWNHKDATDTGVITLCRKELNARYVLLAYNMSIELPRDRPPWRNFTAGCTIARSCMPATTQS